MEQWPWKNGLALRMQAPLQHLGSAAPIPKPDPHANVETNKANGGGGGGEMGRCGATGCGLGQSVMWLDLPSVFQQLLTYTAVSPHISLGQMAALAPLSSTTPHPSSFLKG